MKCGCGSAVYWTQSTQTDRRHTRNTGQCRMEETSHGAAGDVNSTYQHRAARASDSEEFPGSPHRPFTPARHTQEEN